MEVTSTAAEPGVLKKEESLAGKTVATEEQKRYGKVLDIGMKIGFVLLLATFVLYMIGVPKPAVPVDDVSQYWGMKVDSYLEATGTERGWSWLSRMDQGDFLTFAPIAFLAAVTAVCYLTIMPIFIKRKDTIYLVLAGLEVLVLTLAASGVLPSGGH